MTASESTDVLESEGRLWGSARRGLGWSFGNTIVQRLGNLLAGIVLARILAPEDYGVFAVALVVLNVGLSMNELGISLAVVRWQTGLDRIAPTVATIALAWSVVLYGVAFFAAPLIADALTAPEATTLIRVLSVSIIVDALTAVPAALMTRFFMQRTRMVIDVTAFLVSTAVAIGLAINGMGAWCLVWGMVIASIVSSVLTHAWAPQRYPFGLNLLAARSLLAFGLPLAGASLLLFVMLNVDFVIVGRLLGPEDLGFYLLAFNVCSWPVGLVASAARRVTFALFSRLADEPARAGRAFAASMGLAMAATLPLCVLLAGYAEPGISFIYGDKWLPSSEVLRLLCVLGAVRVFVEVAYDYLVSMKRGRLNLLLNAMWLVLLVPALVVGAKVQGLVGVAAAHAIVALFIVVPVYVLFLSANHVRPSVLLRFTTIPIAASIFILLLAAVVTDLVSGTFAQLVLGVASGIVAALALIRPVRRMSADLAGRAAGT